MERAASDTDPETAGIHLELLRRSSPQHRLHLALSLSRSAMSLSAAGLRAALPAASANELGMAFVARLYGPQLAREVRAALAARRA